MRKILVLTSLLAAGLMVSSPFPRLTSSPNSEALAYPGRDHRLQIINMDLDFRPKSRPTQGRLLGYDPVVARVHVGDRIQFVNTDDIVHTATGFAVGGQVVPEHYQFVGDPTKAAGRVIDMHEWSTGNVRAHGKSQIFLTKATGNFYYGCAYHLGKGMRGLIIVQP